MKRLPGIFRDIAPDREPVRLYVAGKLWRILDLETRIMRAVRRMARRQGISQRQAVHEALIAGLEEGRMF